MKSITYKYNKSVNRSTSGAVVRLELTENHQEKNNIIIRTNYFPGGSQGTAESGLDCWNRSAEEALKALSKCLFHSVNYDIVVADLTGRQFIDTNNAAIGIACILAYCQIVDFALTDEHLRTMDIFVSEDWKNDVEQIPDFEGLLDSLALR